MTRDPNCLTPVMTSNVIPSPIVISASGFYTFQDPWKAFGDGPFWYDSWWAGSSVKYGWLKVYNGGSLYWKATSYNIFAGGAGYGPKDWTLKGSNNDSSWTTLDTQTGITWATDVFPVKKTYSISSPSFYKYYKIDITDSEGSRAWIHRLELVGITSIGTIYEAQTSIDSSQGEITSRTAEEIAISTEESIGEITSQSGTLAELSTSGVTSNYVFDLRERPLAEEILSSDYSHGILSNEVEGSISETVIPSVETEGMPDFVLGSISEEVITIDSYGPPGAIYYITVTDTVLVNESVIQSLWLSVSEALGLTDSVAAMLCIKITEILALAETQSVHWTGTSTINDGFVLTDQVARELSLVINEALALADSPSAVLGLIIAEFLAISETVTANWNSTRTVEDTLRLVDLPPMAALSLVLTEALTIVDEAPISHLSLAVYEYLGFTDIVSAAGQFNNSLADEIWAADSVQLGFAQVVSDALAAVDVVSVVALLLNTINESLVVADTVSGALTMPVSVGETLTLTDTVSSQGILYNVIYDTLHLGVTVELDGEVWECYVLNTPKFLPSIYSGFDFNSYCVFENRAYGCKADGVYELTGDTDNGVAFHTGVQFSDTTFGIPNQKRFRKAYVGVAGTSPRMVMETEKGEKKVYAIDSDGEVDASRALRSKKWKLTVTDFDSLDFVKLYPVVLSK